ncbi:cAMP-dependent protein kinase regulatory subunit [Naegleria gruberi]|uniref:cAMP-dependent protein kinase regulatory subunit n=1 Tax=Naegleria gruberi TaxID=5762 RepID=D2V2L4_NAEGR|nr:cAMP-dependent protein kinase regulatory subunit [Naegleria gruberi]EFC48916.1 cAMP-dependent protein kinase regulatory subunit [Naegleria gruberi]|eukprot:XP_002681660.1 cAMP-dependent protein kinase regulatory subunit [Naegleria gruberi strain NEG-M]
MFNSFQAGTQQGRATASTQGNFQVADLQQYLQEKRVEDLFVSLMQAICLERPANVVTFLQQKLQQIEGFASGGSVIQQQPTLIQPQSQQQPIQQTQQPKQTAKSPTTQPPQAKSSISFENTTAQIPPAKNPSPFSWASGSTALEESRPVEKPTPKESSQGVRFQTSSSEPEGIDWNESENRRRRYSISVPRRRGVSSESLSDSKPLTAEDLPVHKKTPDEIQKLKEALSSNALFMSLETEDLKVILDAMFEVSAKQGDNIIRQGDEQGDLFYVLYSGECEAIKKTGNEEKVVKEYQAGDAFGELALIYGTPRAATVRAKSDCKLYAINRITFRRIVMMNTKRKREMYEDFLKRVPLLETLTDYERMTVADALVQETYNPESDKGRYIIKQGDRGDAFYIVIEGEVAVKKRLNPSDESSEEIELTRLSVGDYFGEIALLTDQPRQASVVIPDDVEETVKFVKLNRKDFKNLLGPCEEILKRNMRLYNQYVTASQI